MIHMSLSFLHLPFSNRIWIFREIFFLLFSPEAHAGALVETSRANRLPPVLHPSMFDPPEVAFTGSTSIVSET
jgi:hypothetical protein